jgi:solute carrier family 8 (sodium/calcium exchanger)
LQSITTEIAELGGEARCCSPGHTAKYGSYSIMNLDNNKVVDVQLVQVNVVFIVILLSH